MSIKSTLWIFSGLLFCACYPQYKLVPVLNPGTSSPACVAECAERKQPCVAQQTQLYLECEQQASADYHACKANKTCSWNPYLGRMDCDEPFCIRDSCEKDLSPCNDIFNLCFVACGGVITQKVKCVSFCSQDTPERYAKAVKELTGKDSDEE